MKQDARDRRIFLKASKIAEVLGERKDKSHGANHIYRDYGLHIIYDDYGPNLTVHRGEDLVFGYTLGSINTYRPDVDLWIKKIDLIYDDTVKVILGGLDEKKQDLINEDVKKRWGIVDE